jgi:hypothetical protein
MPATRRLEVIVAGGGRHNRCSHAHRGRAPAYIAHHTAAFAASHRMDTYPNASVSARTAQRVRFAGRAMHPRRAWSTVQHMVVCVGVACRWSCASSWRSLGSGS